MHTKPVGQIDNETGRQAPLDLITRPEERLTIGEFAGRKAYITERIGRR